MKTNKQSKIKVNKSGYKRARFNWSHDVNTTFTWGEIQPTQCKMLIPGSKTTMQAQNLIRLAPMVAPTFGRVKYKTFNQFVPCADVYPNFDPMMAQEPITRNGVTKVPKTIPSIPLGQLSAYCLFGARANIYWADSKADAEDGNYKTRYRKVVNNSSTDWLMDNKMQEIRGYFTTANIFKLVDNGINHSSADGVLPHVEGFGQAVGNRNRVVWFPNAGRSYLNNSFTGDTAHTTTNTSYGITLGMKSLNSLFPIDRSLSKNVEPHAPVLDTTDDTDVEVTMESADYIVEFNISLPSFDNRTYLAIAFELSDYGKRLRKILQGCGYQIDLASDEKVSILPLLAQYKAYFDVFGLQLYQGWETTACAGLIDYISNNFVDNINGFDYTTGAENQRMFSLPCYDQNDGMTLNNSRFVDFMLGEVVNEWYTEDPDFIGAHMAKLAVSPKVDTTGFISVDSSGIDFGAHLTQASNSNSIGESEGQTQPWSNALDTGVTEDRGIDFGVNGSVHGFINQVQHGQVDAELLKRMYRWVNRNTVLGREIAKILRAQGLGKYVDECKSNYIGATDTMITISDVVAQAATEQAALGEFGGKGLQYIEDKTLVFENDEYGYWITLATVVPEAGYTQGLDPTLKALDKFNLYNPDFDAIGMEMTTKDTVVGCRYNIPQKINNTDEIISSISKGFGFIPRYSKFKVAYNLVNGDFNRHNKRNVYLPYTLDKQLNVNDFDSSYRYKQEGGTDNSTGYATLNRSGTTNSMPIASNIWRIPTKYAWLGNFNRIFLNEGLHDDRDLNVHTNSMNNSAPGFSDYNDDNFLSHGIMDVQCYAPMKTIENSYGLEDEDADKAGAEFVSKA